MLLHNAFTYDGKRFSSSRFTQTHTALLEPDTCTLRVINANNFYLLRFYKSNGAKFSWDAGGKASLNLAPFSISLLKY